MTDTNGFIGMAEFVQERLYILSHDIFLQTLFGVLPPPPFFRPPGNALICDKSKRIFPEMKLQGLIPTFMYLGAIYIFLGSVRFGISIFLYCVRELSAQPQKRREGQGTAAKQRAVGCPLPSPPPRG
jgi:hypothetical protein